MATTHVKKVTDPQHRALRVFLDGNVVGSIKPYKINILTLRSLVTHKLVEYKRGKGWAITQAGDEAYRSGEYK